MVGVPSHEQVISPYWGGLQWGRFLKLHIMQIPLKTALRNMNKSFISFVFVKDPRELEREDPCSCVKRSLHPKNVNSCYLIYCFSSWYF